MLDPIMALVVIIKALFVLFFGLSMVPLLVWLERKVSALMQDRIGPNRAAIGFVRLGGLIHLIADSIKMLSKEPLIPRSVHFFHYMLAPVVIAAVALVILPIVPFADVLRVGGREIPMQVLNIDAGLLWYFAMTSLMVYGVVLAGWASNNKFSLLGGMRSSAQLISYELPLGLSVVGIIMLTGTVHLNEIVRQQGDLLFGFLPKWGILLQPLAAVIFIVCAFAETNRAPFDLAEGESELVGGFHTEYAGMLFGTFFMAEYIAMVVAGAMIVTLFLGGWQIPFMSTEFLIAKASLLTQLSLAGGALAMMGLAFFCYRYYQGHTHRFGDIRDKEGLVYSVLLGLGALGALGLLALIFAFGFPQEWGGPIFAALAQMGMFIGKLMVILICFIWVRWTLPRFRYDQLMFLGWKSLLPLALANIFLTGLGIALTGGLSGG
jgi:NADH-quinone oxidoreductase subunit H